MSHKERPEEKQVSDTSNEEKMQFHRDNRRVDTAQAILEFGKFIVTVAQELSHDDQGRARPRY